MNNSMIMASVTAGQLQQKLDTIGHNLSNSNTNGFKRRDVSFSDLLFQQMNNQSNPAYEGGRFTPDGIRVGSGARVAQTPLRLDQGTITESGRELDFAITEPHHFFRIGVMENGEQVNRLTRDGAFYLSEDPSNPNALTLVNSNGDHLLDGGFDRFQIPLDFQSLQLGPTGVLTATMNDGTTEELGQLALTNVLKPQLLESAGGTIFHLPNLEALGFAPEDVFEEVPADEGRLTQGALEASNVDMGREMNELLQTQRHFQFNTRALSMGDEMQGLVNGIRR